MKKQKNSVNVLKYMRSYNTLVSQNKPDYIEQLKKKLSLITLENKKFDINSSSSEKLKELLDFGSMS